MLKKVPICVIGSAPRCGSTAFTLNLRNKLDIRCFLEPWSQKSLNLSLLDKPSELDARHQREIKEYFEFKKYSQEYIVKFFIDDIEYRSPYLEDMKTGYKIGIARRSLINQVASWYIADQRNKYATLNYECEDDYSVNIHQVDLSIYIREVSKRNFLFENCNFLDEKIYYEDIKFDYLQNNPMIKTKLPQNMAELEYAIEKQLKDHIPKHWIFSQVNSKNYKV